MAVQRFRSIEEMSAAPAPRRSSDAFERFIRHCARYREISPRVYPRGVFRYRSLEEAQRARRRWREESAAAAGPGTAEGSRRD